MNHYENLRAEVYKRLYPDGIPLVFGVEVKQLYEYANETHERSGFGVVVSAEFPSIKICDFAGSVSSHKREELTDTNKYRVLGKRLELSHVLRVIQLRKCKRCNGNGGSLHPSSLGYMSCPDCDGDIYYTDGWTIGGIIEWFNLSLPFSHPDNDEACGKVLELLNNNYKYANPNSLR